MKKNNSTNSSKFRAYEEARAFVHTLKIKSVKKWRDYCKSGDKPQDIPSSANIIYKDQWKGWKDFLGVHSKQSEELKPIKFDPWEKWDEFLAERNILKSYDESKDFVQTLGISSEEEWKDYCATGKKPDEIPTHPHKIYKNEWKSWKEFLVSNPTPNITSKDMVRYKSYTEAKEYAKSLNFKYKKQWNDLIISKKLPKDIPAEPNIEYKDEWEGWGVFFGITERLDEFYRSTKDYMEKKFGK